MPHPRPLGASGLALAALCVLAPAGEAAPAGSARPWHGARWHAARMPLRAVPPRAAAAPVVAKPADTAAGKPNPQGEERPVTERPATWTAAEGERACFRGRRKLWQEGEGWVVKKVSLCP